MDNSEISITQALNQVQSWLNAKEYEKVIQACQEILEIEPENQRALSLMKQAETQKYGDLPPANPTAPVAAPAPLAPSPTAAPTTPTPNPASHTPESTGNAFAKLTDSPEVFENSPHLHMSAAEKRKLFLAVLIPAVLVIVIGGLLIWYISDRQREKEIEEEVTPPVEENTDAENPNFEARNDRRTEDMEELVTILENYQLENGSFPSVSQVEDVLLSSGDLDEIPLDPKHGESDRDGQLFGYVYAVFDTEDGDNDAYVLSALFEDSQGMGTEWTKGADILLYPDYRDLSESNVHLLGQSKDADDEDDDEDDAPKVKVRR